MLVFKDPTALYEHLDRLLCRDGPLAHLDGRQLWKITYRVLAEAQREGVCLEQALYTGRANERDWEAWLRKLEPQRVLQWLAGDQTTITGEQRSVADVRAQIVAGRSSALQDILGYDPKAVLDVDPWYIAQLAIEALGRIPASTKGAQVEELQHNALRACQNLRDCFA